MTGTQDVASFLQACINRSAAAGNKKGTSADSAYVTNCMKGLVIENNPPLGMPQGTGTPKTNVPTSNIPSSNPTAYAACVLACDGKPNAENCLSDCMHKYPPSDGSQNPATIGGGSTACGDCSYTNFPACVSCTGQFISHGLASIGINIGLGLVVLIGVLLFFSQDIKKVAGTAVKSLPVIAEL